MKASEFKATFVALIDAINETGEVVIVTKNGRPVTELHPYREGRRSTPFGLHPALPARPGRWPGE
jgi:prevent-host-death family protein